jgi:hypothetical protein
MAPNAFGVVPCAAQLKGGGMGMTVLIAAAAFLCAAGDASEAPTEVSVADYGALGDGRTDDTAAFQAALDAVAPRAGVVRIPPVGGGRGYVLTRTVTVPRGVTLMGAPAGFGTNVCAAFPLPEEHIVGVKIFARPAPDQYEGPTQRPLFRLEPGCAVRGLWILYDEQPLPSDEEFQDPGSPFYYPDFETARRRFIPDHVKPYGPTFYGEAAVNTVIEDIICDRCVDFVYFRTAGKCHFNRLTCHGYRRGFALEEARDVLHLTNFEWVPNGGPMSPGGPRFDERTYSWAYGVIVSQPDNVGIHLGAVDGYSFHDVTCFGVHTGLRLGYSEDFPLYNPVRGENAEPLTPGGGPWGDVNGLKIDQCVIGVHLVWPTHLTNRIANCLLFTGYDDGADFETAAPSEKRIARQGAFVVAPTYGKDQNTGYVATLMASNTIIASFQDSGRFGPAAADAFHANGRAILLGGDVFLELTGLQINPPYHAQTLFERGPAARYGLVRARGVIAGFKPMDDVVLPLGDVEP